ncbi:hypothetical protein GH714_042421 [Hevea brasiliensis]|uniref:Alpha-1,4 glucan phosphorylase n=1 Tax=Hevea brasiliensis TaxID=3981 RepID=A0A6A6MLM4_HEVBR|nr:hypothetical protein GH714_042421 [Hevea brasiliensis]
MLNVFLFLITILDFLFPKHSRVILLADSLDTFAPDSGAIASSIKYHAEFTPSFSPEHFELPKAYMATAESVRDLLIINWNATFERQFSVDATEEVDEIEGPDEETESTNEEEPTKEEEEEEENDVKFEADPALPKIVRMANLCIVGGYAANGVAEIHSEIVKNEVFNEFYKVKRIHEYKRQLLNLLGIVYRYKKMKEMIPEERQARYVPRYCWNGGQWNQSYEVCHEWLCLIGNLDGANVEIRQKVGEDNFFLFGARADEIAGLRKERAEGKFVPDPRFEEVKAFVRCGVFCPYDYEELMGSLEGNEGYGRADYFLVGKDFPSYLECQEKVDEAYRDQKRWTEMSILNTAGSYKFSSDRTVHEYARDIWRIDPVVLP